MQNKLAYRTLRWRPLRYRKSNRGHAVFDRSCPRLILEERRNPGHPTHSMWPDTTTRYRRAVNKSSSQSLENCDGIKSIFYEGPAGLSRLVGMTEPMSRVASAKKAAISNGFLDSCHLWRCHWRRPDMRNGPLTVCRRNRRLAGTKPAPSAWNKVCGCYGDEMTMQRGGAFQIAAPIQFLPGNFTNRSVFEFRRCH